MSQRQLKNGYFILEGLNSFSTVYYLYYLYFLMQTMFGFGNKANLTLAAANGLIYAVGSFWAGRFAQKFGYFTALKWGISIAILALITGTQVNTASGQVVVMSIMVAGMCFTWPALEALVSDRETPEGVQHMIGIYNVVWSGTGALAYFTGGAMLEKLGMKSLFWVPAAIQVGQLGLTFWLESKARKPEVVRNSFEGLEPPSSLAQSASSIDPSRFAATRTFLKLAWLANPFAYIAMNTLVAVMPGMAHKLGLSTMAAGFCCSIWCFARLGAFCFLWNWSGWHYQFKWLLAAYVALVGMFATLLLAPNLTVLVLAQIVFGAAVGLIYYSSLYYSMDNTENHGEHGGIHEAAIGLGNFAGPAIGAISLQLLPQFTNSAAAAVSTLLACGLAGLMVIWRQGRIYQSPNPKCRTPAKK